MEVFRVALWFGIFAVISTSQEFEDDFRIVGGDEAKSHFTSMVSIQALSKSPNMVESMTLWVTGIFGYGKTEYKHFCGGAIIGERWVVTAAHCIPKLEFLKEKCQVVVGTIKWDEGGQSYKIEKAIKHENYDDDNIVNDVALIKTSRTIEFGPLVQPTKLNTDNILPKKQCRLYGWGCQFFIDVPIVCIPRKLKTVQLNSLSNKDCATRMFKDEIPESQLCTHEPFAVQGACPGDSGGPLLCDGKLSGIVSYGMRVCGAAPECYTRVSIFVDWILDHME